MRNHTKNPHKAIVVDTHNDILMRAVDLELHSTRTLRAKHTVTLPAGKREGLMFRYFLCFVKVMKKILLHTLTGKWIRLMQS